MRKNRPELQKPPPAYQSRPLESGPLKRKKAQLLKAVALFYNLFYWRDQGICLFNSFVLFSFFLLFFLVFRTLVSHNQHLPFIVTPMFIIPLLRTCNAIISKTIILHFLFYLGQKRHFQFFPSLWYSRLAKITKTGSEEPSPPKSNLQWIACAASAAFIFFKNSGLN